ncbi:myb family transcription factor EFM-like [Abrus precatorius]|uniref:Myb family transcription factor EFM-like n=1 Tax=Abrus precatorius TaxID=3816 RepID=A0A8B8K5Q7_ABRPR|nr:myb family transcription factor EFM-like [Abrus precatorius]
MASQAELSMDCEPRSYSTLLKSFADQTDQTYKLEEFLSRLEEERLKIDAFKRELPLCMQLLTNAVEASRQQLQAFRSNQGTRPVLEEFIPMKHSNSQEIIQSHEKASNICDKANWMTSVQLWSQASEGTKPQSTITSPKEADIGFSVSPKQALNNKHKNGGAFLPFSKERNSCQGLRGPSEKEMEDKKCEKAEKNCGGVVEQGKSAAVVSEAQTTNPTVTTIINTGGQTQRKARRCWSPDLHRRFVHALQMLGGSQVATPKQIRELMKVDGLTNDEVKSHLQKYRLHTRRPSPSIQNGAPTPQLVVLGGIWVPPEYANTGGSAIYATHPTSHAPPPHYCAATPVPQEFYSATPSPSLLPLPPHHHLHMYKTVPQIGCSPESDVRGGDCSESIEDGKSESSSWKGESGENKGEKIGLAALREQDGEESTGSEITLKF